MSFNDLTTNIYLKDKKFLQTYFFGKKIFFKNGNFLKALGLSINDRISLSNEVERLFYDTFL